MAKYQNKVSSQWALVKNDDRLFVKADKSTNYYKMNAMQYNQLLHANVAKTYKKGRQAATQ